MKEEESVTINITAAEGDLYEFEIIHGIYLFNMQCYFYQLEDTLLLTSVDVEGPGQNTIGRKIQLLLNGVCDAFCLSYNAERIIILGAKRTVGKTRGTFFRPIYRKKLK